MLEIKPMNDFFVTPVVRLSFILLLSSLMFGCAVTPISPETTMAASAHSLGGSSQQNLTPPPALSEQDLPEIELDEQLLFSLLNADMAMINRDYTLAAELYWQLAQSTQDPRIVEQAARLALFERNDFHALMASRLWVKLMPEAIAAREALISASVRNSEIERVQPHLDYLLSVKPNDSAGVFRFVAALLLQEQDLHSALAVMELFVSRHDSDPDALYVLSNIALHAGALKSARKAIEKALEIRPDWQEAVSHYVRVIRLQEKSAEVLTYLEDVQSKFPESKELRLSYARSLVENHQIELALEQYRRVLQGSPDDMETLYVSGLLALQLGYNTEAKANLDRALALGARADMVYFYLAQIAELDSEIAEALFYYRGVQHGEHYVEAKLKLALLLARQGDVDLARKELKYLRERQPAQQYRVAMIEAPILFRDGQLEEAMKVYDAALLDTPNEQELLFGRAMLAEEMGLIDEMERSLSLMLELNPNNVDALNALGYGLIEHTDRYQEAYGYIERAYEQRPDSFAILDSMGWVLYRLGRFDEAIDYLQRSMAIKDDHVVAAHLGEVLWMMGDHQAARDIWQQALEHFPGDKVLVEVIQRFEP